MHENQITVFIFQIIYWIELSKLKKKEKKKRIKHQMDSQYKEHIFFWNFNGK